MGQLRSVVSITSLMLVILCLLVQIYALPKVNDEVKNTLNSHDSNSMKDPSSKGKDENPMIVNHELEVIRMENGKPVLKDWSANGLEVNPGAKFYDEYENELNNQQDFKNNKDDVVEAQLNHFAIELHPKSSSNRNPDGEPIYQLKGLSTGPIDTTHPKYNIIKKGLPAQQERLNHYKRNSNDLVILYSYFDNEVSHHVYRVYFKNMPNTRPEIVRYGQVVYDLVAQRYEELKDSAKWDEFLKTYPIIMETDKHGNRIFSYKEFPNVQVAPGDEDYDRYNAKYNEQHNQNISRLKSQNVEDSVKEGGVKLCDENVERVYCSEKFPELGKFDSKTPGFKEYEEAFILKLETELEKRRKEDIRTHVYVLKGSDKWYSPEAYLIDLDDNDRKIVYGETEDFELYLRQAELQKKAEEERRFEQQHGLTYQDVIPHKDANGNIIAYEDINLPENEKMITKEDKERFERYNEEYEWEQGDKRNLEERLKSKDIQLYVDKLWDEFYHYSTPPKYILKVGNYGGVFLWKSYGYHTVRKRYVEIRKAERLHLEKLLGHLTR